MQIVDTPIVQCPRPAPSRRRAARWLAILSVNVFAAVCFVAIKSGLAYAPPLLFGGLRALVAGTGLLVLAAVTGQRLRPARVDIGPLTLLALTATTATYGAMFGTPTQMGVGLAAVLGNVQPLLILMLGILVLREPLTRGKVVAAVLGLMGVALILAPTFGTASSGTAIGGGLAVTASAGAALGSIVFKRARFHTGLLATTALQLIIGSLPLLIAALLAGSKGTRWTATFVALLLYLALLGTALPTTLWFWLLRGEDAGRVSQFLFLIPILGLMLGLLVFGEPVAMPQAAGVVAILLGLVALSREPALQP